MKTAIHLSTFLLIAILFSSCEKIVRTKEYTANIPEYIDYENLRSAVKNINELKLEKPGKIFLYNDYILINEFEKGVHFFNNSNPRNPVHEAFIYIPGNVDMAVKNGVLYADSYVDLVAIDITVPSKAEELDRAKNVLSYTIPSTEIDYSYPVSEIDENKGVVTGFHVGKVKEECVNDECGDMYYNNMPLEEGGNWGMASDAGTPVSFSGNATNVRTSTASTNGASIAGSMARFLMIENYLYTISDLSKITVFDITNVKPTEVTSFDPMQDANSWGNIETLFAFKEHLFIGSNTGMLTYRINNPANPSFVSVHQHFTACDPVVANDDYAFITLRSGNTCGGNFENVLEVLDIENLMNPEPIRSYQMSNPFGLTIDNNDELVFVCDGWDGLKVYSFSDPDQLDQNLKSHFSGIDTYDVIAFRNILHVIGSDGLTQFEYNSDGQLSQLSNIAL